MGQLFSKKNKEVFSAPLGIDNPVTVQVLGICSYVVSTRFQNFTYDGYQGSYHNQLDDDADAVRNGLAVSPVVQLLQ